MSAAESDADLVVVIAHSLLGPVVACETAARTLLARGEQLPPAIRQELLDHIVRRAEVTAYALQDLVRGRAPELIAALDSLAEAAPSQP